MKTRRIAGGGGTALHVVETGNPEGRPILFIHGFSQSWLAWSRQLNSDLADDHRLVAFDLRGHGLSDKPRDAYDDAKIWAADVNAVIQSLQLEQPLLCGWSYGPLLILDYIRHYGEAALGGIHFVGAISKLGTNEALSVLRPSFSPLFRRSSRPTSKRAPAGCSRCYVCASRRNRPRQDLYLMLGYNAVVPPAVRQALFSRSFDNDDLLRTIRKPVLITHGIDDAVVSPTVVDQHTSMMTHAQVHLMPKAGHAPFWDDAADFNRRLRAFAASVSPVGCAP